MLDTEHTEFQAQLSELFGALDKPLTESQRAGFWKGLQRMSLVEFGRCRDQVLRELADGEPPRRFGVGEIWAAKKRLRAAAPDKPPVDPWQGDRWDEAANFHLLRHIAGALHADPRCYGRPASYMGMKTLTTKNADASPEFIRNVQTLVAQKNHWAAQMRGSDPGEGVPLEEQREVWRECMRRAEAEIAGRVTAVPKALEMAS